MHRGYPARPSGGTEIRATFGSRCTPAARSNDFYWTGIDTSDAYLVRYHKKLGGSPVDEWTMGDGGSSTNLDTDVRGHIGNAHLYAKGGIYGYYCRVIAGTNKWSTHSWGIAVDLNARHEHYHCHVHSAGFTDMASYFKSHWWVWGRDWGPPGRCDTMHFQYASDY